MGLITEEVEMTWNPSNRKYYEDLGYTYIWRDKFIIPVEHLPNNSCISVDVQCDGCEETIKNVRWVDYRNCRTKEGKYFCTRCSHNKHSKWISFYDWCYQNLSKDEADKIMLRWDCKKNLDKNGKLLTPQEISYRSRGFNKKGYWFKCLDHPEHKSEQKSIDSFVGGQKGSIDCHQCNLIVTTHPDLVKLLVYESDAYKYSIGSNKKILMKCPDCGYEKEMVIHTLTGNGFSCSRCSDGASYPEKFIFNMFEQLLYKDFQTQLSKINYKWIDNFRYDFYIKKLNCICEVHGKQHYEETKGSWKTTTNLIKIQNNDKHKEQLAKNNGIKNYIILDCRKSELDWIKNSVMQSELPTLLEFKNEDIDWLKCHEAGCNNLVKEISELWNNGKSTLNIQNKLKISKSTAVKYLKQGAELGWCNYNPKSHRKDLLLFRKNKGKKIICLTTNEIFDSIADACDKYNIKQSSMSNCCRNKTKSSGRHPITGEKLRWIYYNEYIKEI